MYKVKEAAKLLNTSISTLHYYEKRRLIHPHRGENGYRYYSDEDILSMKLILLMRHYHFSIDEIKLISTNFTDNLQCQEAADKSRQFFQHKIFEFQEIIKGYRDLITIIEGLPLMNTFDDLSVKKDETIGLVEELYGRLD
ncbi:MerR family transcriptional regulator [Enterococcus sp. AZ196]|uniref:MerR family transcriptional regulator n=1 Tax=Enterococcus sp. AZ196 TaxID=2774659 RepID=UPI003D2C51A5